MGIDQVHEKSRVTDEPAEAAKAGSVFPWGSLFIGDCLGITGGLPSGSVDLIYADPPFFTNREQKGRAESRKREREKGDEFLRFEDRWQGGLHAYLEWLKQRVQAMRRLLAPEGVFLLHLDWHAVHYAKVMCDQVFGAEQFQNELIWYYQTGGASKDRFSRKHDTILVYSMIDRFYFDGRSIAIPRTPKAMKRAQCPTGARIKLTDTHKNPDDVLVVPALNPMANERNGYPTQKPVALLETLIKSLCPPAGGVADFFCGSGTTLLAAQRLGRKWVGADANEAAIVITRRRLTQSERS